ncbi:FxsB family cyclophane-forming radical SAM/SPASM peptide maturase [Spirillospora sp. NPDC047279]|uniref:FxsB family cyclophane-forming radical SAM/SPASM peptide maturase n=1 Tax=Spirillospora sp. NPDC047279 TaxID=3155478 RepID=UPI0033F440AA
MTVDLGSSGTGAGAEWPGSLDLPGMLASGWRPVPFREFVLKVHSRCDLACDYCYMYEMADQSWRGRPAAMPEHVLDAAAARIGEHATAHGLDSIDLILHGGEPLLAGPGRLERAVTAVRDAAPGVRVQACVQTNAVRLDERFLDLFARLDVHVGVSLDGDAAGHDRHRRRRGGGGSHDAVAAALRLLTSARYRHLFDGLLCTIDLRNEPDATYDALMAWGPPSVDFLLPHGTWAEPPPGRIPGDPSTPYADWLIPLFDRWYREPPAGEVRLFGEIVRLLLGGRSTSESVGLSPVGMVVIETDGSIEQVDVLKAAFPGAPETGLHVDRDPLDAALLTPGIAARQIGAEALAPECLGCRVRAVCGGGLYAHRYRPGRGFANPSVYCLDLYRLIDHVRGVLVPDLAALRQRPSPG